MNPFSKLRDLIHSLEDDFDKSYDKNNSAAGTRVRKGMQDLKTEAARIRKEVQDMKNTTKANTPAPAPGAVKKTGPVRKPAAGAPAAAKKAPAKK